MKLKNAVLPALLAASLSHQGLGLAASLEGGRFFQNVAERPSQARISMSDAMEIVRQRTGGRVLLAQPARVDGHEAYRIKVLTRDGEVRVYLVNAETGEIR